MRTSAFALAFVGLLAACGPSQSTSSAGGADPEEPVVSTPDPSASVPSGSGAQRVTPRPGMKGVHSVAWDKARIVDQDTLVIRYWSGVEPCNVLDRVEVAYRERAVEVTLFEGREPLPTDTACIEIALLKSVEVELDEPLGGRKVVDGAA